MNLINVNRDFNNIEISIKSIEIVISFEVHELSRLQNLRLTIRKSVDKRGVKRAESGLRK